MRGANGVWRRVLRIAAGVVLVAAFGERGVHAGQAAEEGAAALNSFAVVSVRPTQIPCKDSGLSPTPDGLHILCFPLQIAMQLAYGIHDRSRILGLPDSIGSALYDIEAKVDPSEVAAYSKLTKDQRNLMFQALLEDRFKLKAHRESKELPVYALVVAKSGSKLKESKPDEAGAQGGPLAGPMMWRKGRGQIVSRSSSLSFFLDLLSQEVGRPVIDRTGLVAKYDFTLKWTPDQGAGSTAVGVDASEPPADAGPSIFTALEEQLGLKLEPTKTPLDVLVVEHIEKPSEN